MVAGFALMTLVTASIASLFVQEEQEPDEEAEQRFDAESLSLLVGIAQRFEAIEATHVRQADGASKPVSPPSDP